MKVSLSGDALKEYEDAIEKLKAMTKEERLKWFEDNASDDFAFGCEINGTIYIAECIFRKPNGETLLGKTCRILVNADNV
ncbi:MAG: hypothetical protein II072_06320 [Clostridia bacterium]|nr:hypothetical protein [Clostridia bacterium]